MTSLEILHFLYPYLLKIKAVKQAEAEKFSGDTFTYTAGVSYDQITLEVLRTSGNISAELHMELTFEIRQQQVFVKEVYARDAVQADTLTATIIHDNNLHGVYVKAAPVGIDWPDADTRRYLSIADTIAAEGMHVCAGDDYRPGLYSTIELTETHIILSQINHLNSRSLDHKNDYSLRDLVCSIPVNSTAITDADKRHADYILGAMHIAFSDRSSRNNRTAGDAILLQINKQLDAYEKL